MNAVILQPSYIPWRGFFDQIRRADIFVFYDDVQYDRRGWRNRNQIKTPNGLRWLTIPVHSRGCQLEKTAIRDIRIDASQDWQRKHWESLRRSYGKAPHFARYAERLAPFYERHVEFLADYTIEQTIALSESLGIRDTRFVRSSALSGEGTKSDRLLSVLRQVGATHYISGPSASDYLEEDKFKEAGITFEFMTYNYPEYPQLYPPYDPAVSVVDLLFMTGEQAGAYIWGDGFTGAREGQ